MDLGESETSRRTVLGLMGGTAVWNLTSYQSLANEKPAESAVTLQSETAQQVAKLNPNDGDSNDVFGYEVALENGTAVISAPGDEDPNGKRAGSAYVFIKTDESWAQQAKLTPDDGESEEQFGTSVALAGDTVVIGAVGDEVGENLSAGSAYVFERENGNWTQQAKLTPDDGDSMDRFGFATGVVNDTALVGAPTDEDPNGEKAGATYVFERADGGWTQQAKLAPNDGDSDDAFGSAIALEGKTALVGAPTDEDPDRVAGNAGSAYVFARENGNWTQQDKLAPDDGNLGDLFGFRVALSNDVALVGASEDEEPNGEKAGSAYVFERTAGSWTQTAKLVARDGDSADRFGYAVAIEDDTAVVTASSDENPNGKGAGSAYVFKRVNDRWTQQTSFAPANGDRDDHFGFRVALANSTALVGATWDEDPNGDKAGSAYVYTV